MCNKFIKRVIKFLGRGAKSAPPEKAFPAARFFAAGKGVYDVMSRKILLNG